MNTVHLSCLIALSVCKLITCHPIQKETIQTDVTRENPRDLEAKISSYGFVLITKLINGIRNMEIYQESNGAVLLKKRSKDCLSLLDLKSNIIMCLDATKKPYMFVDGITDCFKTIQRKTSNHVLCSRTKDAVTKKSPPSMQPNNYNSHLRLRRNQHFDPSDPLGSENPKSRTMNYRRQNKEHEHNSNVSRETITSCDDPLHVLLSKSPVSPNLQKEKKYNQVAPSDPF